jgi:hypothetical protein
LYEGTFLLSRAGRVMPIIEAIIWGVLWEFPMTFLLALLLAGLGGISGEYREL